MLNAQCYSCTGHLTQVHPLQLIWESRDAYSVDTQIIRRCSKKATRLNSGAIHASSCCESCSNCIYFIRLILPCKAGRVPMQPDQAALAVSIHISPILPRRKPHEGVAAGFWSGYRRHIATRGTTVSTVLKRNLRRKVYFFDICALCALAVCRVSQLFCLIFLWQ